MKTYLRERVVDFSEPFLSFDVRRNEQKILQERKMFSFLRPLAMEVWLCILLAIFVVGVALFITARFSPREWRVVVVPEPQTLDSTSNIDKIQIVNDFSFWASVWFVLCSILHQGGFTYPRSFAGRIVISTWWIFALAIVTLYTANLASYLIMLNIQPPMLVYDQITKCPLDNPDEEPSWTDDYRRCEMLVTIENGGFKHFAVALPRGSQLLDGVNLALQDMKKNGELQQLINYWFVKTECDYVRHTGNRELTIDELAGLFYMLVTGLVLALIIAMIEFAYKGRQKAEEARVTLREALHAKPSASPSHVVSAQHRTDHREQDRAGIPWNGGSFAGSYYSPGHNAEEEPTPHGSFAHV